MLNLIKAEGAKLTGVPGDTSFNRRSNGWGNIYTATQGEKNAHLDAWAFFVK